MIVTCENCSAGFTLNDSIIKPSGSKVRCSKCKHVFVVYPPDANPETPIKDKGVESGQKESALQEDSFSHQQSGSESETSAAAQDESIESSEKAAFPEATEADSGEFDDFDFSEIENLLESEAAQEPEPSTEEQLDDLELDLKLDLDPLNTAEEATEIETQEATASDSMDDFDFDFSEIDDLLEIDPAEAPEASAEEKLEDLELELELDPPNLAEATAETEAQEAAASDPSDNFDFSKIEEMLEMDDASSIGNAEKEDRPELEEELELDLELDSYAISETESKDDEIDLEFDVEVENEDEQDVQQVSESTDAGIEDLVQSSVGEKAKVEAEPHAEESEAAAESFVGFPGDAAVSNEMEETIIATEPPPQPPKKKKILVPAIISLLVILLAAGGYAYFIGIDQIGIRLPFISGSGRTELPNNEKNKVMPVKNSIHGRFLNNTEAGNLFVITGQVKNTSSQPQGFIKVTGTLITKDNATTIPKTVYCGNTLSDIELSHTTITEVNQRLLKRTGDKQSNARIEPGSEIPFMIVFSNLPDNLENFTVEVSDYLPIEPQK